MNMKRNYLIIFAILSLFIIAGCGHCIPKETRCNGETVEICNSAENWEPVQRCNDIEPGQWVCVELDTDTEAHDTGEENNAECKPADTDE